ncbi:MAG: tetratricopeptide repeat protein [Polyangiaceae bacterium]|jgi:tetratricopeptide (TPR) repeat protein|nr:tetratricopeptide repeat protein [Polyangiaceae bacterium]
MVEQQTGLVWGHPAEFASPFVGRSAELAQLGEAFAAVEREKGTRVVTVLGGPGVGKSRLVHEFLTRLHAERGWPFPHRTYRGSARGTQAAYGIFHRLLRDRFGLADGVAPEMARAHLREQVASVLSDRKVGDVLYFLGPLVDLSFADSPVTRALADDADQARLVRRAVVRSFFEADAAAAPLLLVFEDAHEASRDSLDLITYLVAHLRGPVLLVCVGRNELLARAEGFAELAAGHHRLVELDPLSEPEAVQVAHALLAPTGEPPEALVEAACSVAGGNPLLIERMVRVFQDTGVLVPGGEPPGPAWRVDLGRLASVRLPLTVDDAVEARIAALNPDERRVLEQASAMGSVFWLGGLVVIGRAGAEAPELWTGEGGDDVARLRRTLDELVERDYVLQLPDATFAGDTEYVFKHNKEREKIARLPAPAEARRWHGALADWLEHHPQVRSHEEHVGMLARHCELAGRAGRAAYAYLEAGDVARAQYAYQKAADYYAKGLALLGEGNAVRRVRALYNAGDVLAHLGRADEAFERFVEMRALAYRLDLLPEGGRAHHRIGRARREAGELEQAERHLAAGLSLFERAVDEAGIASTLDEVGTLHWVRGEHRRALREIGRAMHMRKQQNDRLGLALSLTHLGLVLHDAGRWHEALDAFGRALAVRREAGDPLGIATSLTHLGAVAYDQGDYARSLSLFQEALGVAREVGDKNRLATVMTRVGESHLRLGDRERAQRYLDQAEDLCDELGDKRGMAEAVRGLGRAYLLLGDLGKARWCASRAVDLFAAVQNRAHLGVALRALGDVLAAGGDEGEDGPPRAREAFQRSAAIFEELGNEVELARTFQAHAAFVTTSTAFGADDALRREAGQMRERAEITFRRLRQAVRETLPPEQD